MCESTKEDIEHIYPFMRQVDKIECECMGFKPKQALESYEQNLKGHPYRFNGIYGAAKAAEKLNDIKLARLILC